MFVGNGVFAWLAIGVAIGILGLIANPQSRLLRAAGCLPAGIFGAFIGSLLGRSAGLYSTLTSWWTMLASMLGAAAFVAAYSAGLRRADDHGHTPLRP